MRLSRTPPVPRFEPVPPPTQEVVAAIEDRTVATPAPAAIDRVEVAPAPTPSPMALLEANRERLDRMQDFLRRLMGNQKMISELAHLSVEVSLVKMDGEATKTNATKHELIYGGRGLLMRTTTASTHCGWSGERKTTTKVNERVFLADRPTGILGWIWSLFARPYSFDDVVTTLPKDLDAKILAGRLADSITAATKPIEKVAPPKPATPLALETPDPSK